MTVRIDEYGTSSIAFTAYNLLALKAKPTSSDELFEDVKTVQHPLCTLDLFKRAMDVLVKDKKYIHGRDGFYWLKDQKRRQVVSRNITDSEIDEKTGEIKGGWEGWTVIDNVKGPMSISEAIK
jgi:hypothetical protein